MKKFLLLVLCLFSIAYANKKIDASIKPKYSNLIDMKQVEYDSDKKLFYSNQKISIEKGEIYTLVATNRFFGEVISDNLLVLDGKELETTCYDDENNICDFNIVLKTYYSGLHVANISSNINCSFTIDDFLTRGYTKETLPLNDFIIYKGTEADFQGFRVPEVMDEYIKVEEEITIHTPYDNKIELETILANFKAYDNNDGFISSINVISDNYSNSNDIGEFEVELEVLDSSLNKSELTVKIIVIDNIKPQILGDDILEIDVTDTAPSIDFILSKYKAYDNKDGDISKDIIVKESELDQFEANTIREYIITLSVLDKANNECEKEIILKMIDTVAPTLVVQDMTIKSSELGRHIEVINVDSMVVSVKDNTCQPIVSYNYQEILDRGIFKGDYAVIFKAKDTSGNETIKTAYIHIIDDISPEFYIHSGVLKTSNKKPLKVSEIKEKIKQNLNDKGVLFDEVFIISTDYFSNEHKSGSYELKYMYKYNDTINYAVMDIFVKKENSNIYWVLIIIPITTLALGVLLFRRKRHLKNQR